MDTLYKLLNILSFNNHPIKKKFLWFSIATLFWVVFISSISLITMFEMNSKSKYLINVIEPQQRTGNIVIRKLRGASISVYKLLLSKDTEIINENFIRARSRLEDSRSYLNVLLNGGRIRDYSRATGTLFADFQTEAITDPEKRRVIEQILDNLDKLNAILESISNFSPDIKNQASLIALLEDYDRITHSTIVFITNYIYSLDQEWTRFKEIIDTRLMISIVLTCFTFVLAVGVSMFFGAHIASTLTKQIRSIISQLKTLSAGKMDLNSKLEVLSKDEVGELSLEFNKLMDNIAHVTNFKKIIEEDDSIEDVYIRLGLLFVEHLRLENCVIYEISTNGNSMNIVFPPQADGIAINCALDVQLDCELCRAKRTGHTVSSIESPNICKYFTEGRLNVHVCVPMLIGGKVGAILQVVCFRPTKENLIDFKQKIDKASQYIVEVQPALEAKKLMQRLKDSSIKDVLTGLYNRRFIDESFENIVAGTLRRNSTIGLLMCDIDFFKQTNDVYGHDTGDMVLKETATIVRNSVRSSDLVIRFGGEEFLVLLVDVKEGDSQLVAEKIRSTVQELKIKTAGGYIKKTISIGVSEFPKDTQNFWEAIKYADVALYKAKETGRNKVMRFDISMWTEDKY